ncbi:MAG: hypothetical protein V1707_02090 [bacterium]
MESFSNSYNPISQVKHPGRLFTSFVVLILVLVMLVVYMLSVLAGGGLKHSPKKRASSAINAMV